MTGFAIMIGSCKIVPASPKLALLLVMWIFGTAPGVSYDDYKAVYAANGGGGQIEEIEDCFAQWPGKPEAD